MKSPAKPSRSSPWGLIGLQSTREAVPGLYVGRGDSKDDLQDTKPGVTCDHGAGDEGQDHHLEQPQHDVSRKAQQIQALGPQVRRPHGYAQQNAREHACMPAHRKSECAGCRAVSGGLHVHVCTPCEQICSSGGQSCLLRVSHGCAQERARKRCVSSRRQHKHRWHGWGQVNACT